MLADMAFGKAAPIHLALFFGRLRFRNEKRQGRSSGLQVLFIHKNPRPSGA